MRSDLSLALMASIIVVTVHGLGGPVKVKIGPLLNRFYLDLISRSMLRT